MPRKDGQFWVEDFFLNTGGLNTADSPFVVAAGSATGGKNFDYRKRGGVGKRFAHDQLNDTADTQLKSLGLGLWDKPTAVREVIRAAGRKLQVFDIDAHTFTNLSEDTTAAGTNFLAADTTQPVVNSMFNSASAGVLWMAGGGMDSIYGAYSATKVTKNGVPAPTASAFTATAAAGGTLTAGEYYYTLVYRKASTQALSNGVLEANATTSGGNLTINLAWTLTNNDTTKYDKIYVYRSAINGASGFTAGSLVTILDSSTTSYADTGTVTTSAVTVPRANSISLDNSELPSGTYNSITLFKRRLVAAYGNTVCLSDINKSESWPTYQRITIPAGGDITGLAIITLSSAATSDVEEILCVFQQRKLWVITGDGTLDDDGLPDWQLKYINSAGAPNQVCIVPADGKLAWLNYRGFYMWAGNGKPAYVSKLIEDKFGLGGDIDKSKLKIAWGMFTESRGELQWCLSSKTYGEQKYVLKMDLSASLSGQQDSLGNMTAEAVFSPDVLTFPAYSGLSFLSSQEATEELIYYGDSAGFVYSGYATTLEGGAFVDFEYLTPHLTFGTPGKVKRAHKVVVWVLDKGNYDLSLSYWSDFRYRNADGGQRATRISPNNSTSGFLWGNAQWGTGTTWGAVASRPRPVVFNLADGAEGETLRLQLAQYNSSKQCLIYGFSIFYSEVSASK
jgi:hypothetical protein